MNNAHHIDSDTGVQPELLCDPWYFIGSKHDSQAEEHIAGEGQQTEIQQCGLHKRRQADGYHLLAPLAKSVGVPTGNRKHIQCSDRHLNEQNAASFDVAEKNLYHTVCTDAQSKRYVDYKADYGCRKTNRN